MTIPAVASRSSKCPRCATVLDRADEPCWKCGREADKSIESANSAQRSFKPYVHIETEFGKQLGKTLTQAFSEIDPGERPWCGIGAKVDLLTVSPRAVTVAVLPKVRDAKKGVIHVPQNWREPWQVEADHGQKHELEVNPATQAETALRDITHSLRSFLKTNEYEGFPLIRCLILFPDGLDLQGPKDFSIIDSDEVVRLSARTFRDLAQEIEQTSINGRFDSRSYRKWLESSILRSNDDSIFATWLDPAFDPPTIEPPKRQLWQRSRRRLDPEMAEEKKVASCDVTPNRPAQVTFTRRQLQLSTIAITIIIVALIGWRSYAPRATTSVVHPRPHGSVPRSDNPPAKTEVSQAIVQNVSVADDEKADSLPVSETAKQSELRDEPAAKQEAIDNNKTRARMDASENLELKRQKVERQVRNAIFLRAIEGVTVSVLEDTAYLEGHVETEAQRSAAEKAARSVPEIKQLRSSIQVRDSGASDS
jgi:hypothetical protein